jgi:excisionase family DNA binding protein
MEEDLVIVKGSDIKEMLIRLFAELKSVRKEIEELKEHENELKAYTAEEVAQLIGFHPKTIRKMVRKKILAAVYAVSGKGQYRITALSIKEYLASGKGKKSKHIKS